MTTPDLRPTEPATLVVGALAAAAVAWILINNFYRDLPPLGWSVVVVIGGIAAFLAVVAQQLWARIHRRGPVLVGRRPGGGFEPVDPLAVVRFALLAKASSLAGAILAGFFGGLVPWLAIESARFSGARDDLPPTIGGLVAALALMAAAVWLERACRVPQQPDDDERESSDGS